MRRRTILRGYMMTFPKKETYFWTPNPISLYCMIFLLIRGIGFGSKVFKDKREAEDGLASCQGQPTWEKGTRLGPWGMERSNETCVTRSQKVVWKVDWTSELSGQLVTGTNPESLSLIWIRMLSGWWLGIYNFKAHTHPTVAIILQYISI